MWASAYNWLHNKPDRLADFYGPFRLANISGDYNNPLSYSSWSPRDTISRLADGTSNQLMVGEKHINARDMGNCANYGELQQTGSTPHPYTGKFAIDCSYVGNNHTSLGSVAGLTLSNNAQADPRNLTLLHAAAGTYGVSSYPIQRSSDPTWPYPYGGGGWPYSYFGSPHTGICNFVLGDGAVRSLSNSTPTGILGCLGTVSDGNAVSIP